MKKLALKILQEETDGFESQSRLRDDVLDAMVRFKNESEQLTIPDVVGRSEQLKTEVFSLANKLAVAGEGDAAVAMHRIHNRL